MQAICTGSRRCTTQPRSGELEPQQTPGNSARYGKENSPAQQILPVTAFLTSFSNCCSDFLIFFPPEQIFIGFLLKDKQCGMMIRLNTATSKTPPVLLACYNWKKLYLVSYHCPTIYRSWWPNVTWASQMEFTLFLCSVHISLLVLMWDEDACQNHGGRCFVSKISFPGDTYTSVGIWDE